MTDHYKFENVPLPYEYDALEPYIDTLTMHLHHDRHLQGYINKLNAALKDCPRLQKMTLEQLICCAGSMPKYIGTPIAHNAGGVYNHIFYFDGLSPCSEQHPTCALSEAIDRTFGDFQSFKEKFKAAGLSVFGSGYAWLVSDRCGKVSIITTANQETPLTRWLCPILNMDVWEHAYYLKHYNLRGDYIEDWFNIVNWSKANERYLNCQNR